MIRIDLYQFGSGYRVRAHHHLGDAESRCYDHCDEYSVQRAYPQRDAKPGEIRQVVTMALMEAVGARGISHEYFLQMLTNEEPLF